jgi:hypothetical protein
MNPDSLWRQSLARRIAPAYSTNPNIAAVILGGSTARGHADRYSDIELGVFWLQPPTEIERNSAIVQSGGHLIRLYPYDPIEEVWSDDFTMGVSGSNAEKEGVFTEVVHYTTEFMNQTLDAVLLQHNPDELKQNLIAGVFDGIPLHNPTLILEWKTRAADYPQGLQVAVINRHAQIDHFWRWAMFLERGPNLMMLYHSFTSIQQKLLHVLLALNRIYYFGFKWLDVVISRLNITPPNLRQRLIDTFQIPPADASVRLSELVEETYDLVEEHCPQVDVSRLRRIFRYQRSFWDEPPL